MKIIQNSFALALIAASLLSACKKEKPQNLVEAENSTLSLQNSLANIKICTELNLDEGIAPRGATRNGKTWNPGDTLTVSLSSTGSSSAIRSKVRHYASKWLTYANINFKFVKDDPTAQIRVSFTKGGSNSYIGTDALKISSDKSTMNFGWLREETSDRSYSDVVVHEFGHALGLIHEHMSPAADIPWDKEAVYAYYMGSPNNWSKEKIDSNLFKKYNETQTNFSEYDRYSIMHYTIPNELTIGDFEVKSNYQLSSKDKEFIASVYPGR
ncbi:M12 family metallopeptidase [Pedobacter sp. MW01-1-1]|uniref:M12 family metallopeptidase n=1 Tax=Pedobacter sp. MW01-1-1 TaxID=3383027 RepID=UPI003FEE94ED